MEPIDNLLIHPPYQRGLGSGVFFPLGLGYLARPILNAGFLPAILNCTFEFRAVDNDSPLVVEKWLKQQIPERLLLNRRLEWDLKLRRRCRHFVLYQRLANKSGLRILLFTDDLFGSISGMQ